MIPEADTLKWITFAVGKVDCDNKRAVVRVTASGPVRASQPAPPKYKTEQAAPAANNSRVAAAGPGGAGSHAGSLNLAGNANGVTEC